MVRRHDGVLAQAATHRAAPVVHPSARARGRRPCGIFVARHARRSGGRARGWPRAWRRRVRRRQRRRAACSRCRPARGVRSRPRRVRVCVCVPCRVPALRAWRARAVRARCTHPLVRRCSRCRRTRRSSTRPALARPCAYSRRWPRAQHDCGRQQRRAEKELCVAQPRGGDGRVRATHELGSSISTEWR